MSELNYAQVFSSNLNFYLKQNNLNQKNLVTDLKLKASTVSNWCTGKKVPRMKTVDMLCEYFNINRSSLLEDKENLEYGKNIYLSEDLKELVQIVAAMPNESKMIKGMQTIDQYKIMQHIQSNFMMDAIYYELINKNSIKITDSNGESMTFKYENGEIVPHYAE